MKKAFLTPGRHGVILRNGHAYIVVAAQEGDSFLMRDDGYTTLGNYGEDFRHSEFPDMDIVKVFSITEGALNKGQKVTIWQESNEQKVQSGIDSANKKIASYRNKIAEQELIVRNLQTRN
ncbi:hypothetical protein AB4254_08330 [Vibrio breoganii]